MMTWDPKGQEAQIMEVLVELKEVDRNTESDRWIELKRQEIQLLKEAEFTTMAEFEQRQLDRWLFSKMIEATYAVPTPVPWHSRLWTLLVGT